MTKVELYDPHPGLLGAVMPLPKPMKDLAASLDGVVLSLDEAIDRLTPMAESLGGRLEVVEKYQFISFRLGDVDNLPMHLYRLIRYKEAEIQNPGKK